MPPETGKRRAASDARRRRLLLLMPSTSYRARAFIEAARRVGAEVVIGSDGQSALAAQSGPHCLLLGHGPIGETVAHIVDFARRQPLCAIVGTDDETTLLAATASRALGLAHNRPDAVALTRDKLRFRRALVRAGVRVPWFAPVALDGDIGRSAGEARYPCVLKPLSGSASRGVIRVDDEAAFIAACERIGRMLARPSCALPAQRTLLAESFIPGVEVALEGLLDRGELKPIALFDKPDPLDGPFFEETIYVTPSRLPPAIQHAIREEAARAAAAIGLTEGPVHAELRVNSEGAWMIEMAARPIGGLCSRVLPLPRGVTLEELIVRHALRETSHSPSTAPHASGVMMIPIPAAGVLRGIGGLDAARAVDGVDDVVISIAAGDSVEPLPEGDRYLGFIFARGSEPAGVEAALRRAHAQLAFDIRGTDA